MNAKQQKIPVGRLVEVCHKHPKQETLRGARFDFILVDDLTEVAVDTYTDPPTVYFRDVPRYRHEEL